MSSAYTKQSRCVVPMFVPFVVFASHFTSRSFVIANIMGDSADPCFVPRVGLNIGLGSTPCGNLR